MTSLNFDTYQVLRIDEMPKVEDRAGAEL